MEYLRNFWMQQKSTASSASTGNLWRKASLDVVIMGAGRLGQSLITFPSFTQHGVRVVGVFDSDPSKIGLRLHGIVVESPDQLFQRVQQNGVCRAIIAVPPPAAQMAADQLVEAGIRLILNYSPVNITVPFAVVCERIDPALHFARLSFEPSFVTNLLFSSLDKDRCTHVLPKRSPVNERTNGDHLTGSSCLTDYPDAIFPSNNFSLLSHVSRNFPFCAETIGLSNLEEVCSAASISQKAVQGRTVDSTDALSRNDSFFFFLQDEKMKGGREGANSVSSCTTDEPDLLSFERNCSYPTGCSSVGVKPPSSQKEVRNAQLRHETNITESSGVNRILLPGEKSGMEYQTAHLRIERERNTTPTPQSFTGPVENIAEVEFRIERPASAPVCAGTGSLVQEQVFSEERNSIYNFAAKWRGSPAPTAPRLKALIGLDDAQDSLRKCFRKDIEGNLSFSGVLLYGPPGSGKSSVASRIISEKVDTFECFSVSSGELTDSDILKALFYSAGEAAASRPTIIYIDSVDILCKSDRIKLSLQNEMDCLPDNVLVIASTSLPWEIDVSVLRHFERRILVPLPDPAARELVLRQALMNRNIPLPQPSGLEQLVARTEGYSVCDLVLIVKDSVGCRKEQNQPVNLDKSVSHIKPSISREIFHLYASFAARFGHESPCLGPARAQQPHPPSYLSLYC